MGKPTGFKELPRKMPSRRPVELRILDWNEIYVPFGDKRKHEQELRDQGALPRLYNPEMVTLEKPDKPEDVSTLRRMLENHVKFTDSPVAKAILADWDREIQYFVKVMPNDYRRVLEHQAEIERKAAELAERKA